MENAFALIIWIKAAAIGILFVWMCEQKIKTGRWVKW
jgi:hypothetical protein